MPRHCGFGANQEDDSGIHRRTMKRTSSALSNLLLLQEIEVRESNQALQPALREEVRNRIRAIRTLLPNSLLIHRDRMREQGRLSLAPIRDKNNLSRPPE